MLLCGSVVVGVFAMVLCCIVISGVSLCYQYSSHSNFMFNALLFYDCVCNGLNVCVLL